MSVLSDCVQEFLLNGALCPLKRPDDRFQLHVAKSATGQWTDPLKVVSSGNKHSPCKRTQCRWEHVTNETKLEITLIKQGKIHVQTAKSCKHVLIQWVDARCPLTFCKKMQRGCAKFEPRASKRTGSLLMVEGSGFPGWSSAHASVKVIGSCQWRPKASICPLRSSCCDGW